MNRRLVIGLNLAGFQYGQVAKTYDLVPKFGAFTLFGEHRVVFGIEIAVHVLFNQNFSVISRLRGPTSRYDSPQTGFIQRPTDFSNPAHQGPILGHLSRGIFPSSYGRTRLALLARDPEWALAYWEVRASQIDEAVAALKKVTTNLRLINPLSGKVLACFEVPAASGRYYIPIPQDGRYYAADLVMAHGDRMIVLARSKVMYAPRNRPRFGTSFPVFAGRGRQLEAIRSGKPILHRSGALPVSGGASANLLTARLLGRVPVRTSGGVKLASEARLLLIGSEARLWSIGSEGRLLGVRRRRFFGLLTPVFLVRPAHIELVVGLLGRAFGRGANAGGDAPQYVLEDYTDPVNIGEPDGWAAGTWYAPYDSYSWAPAPDQTAPSKGVPGTYAQYDGKGGWIEVSPTQSPNDSSSTSPIPSSVTSVTDASTGQTTTTTTFTAPSGMNDGSTITTVVAVTTDAEGNAIGPSISTVTAFADGGWTSVTLDSNGNRTETVTDADGSQTSSTTKADGTSSLTITDTEGNSNTIDTTEEGGAGTEGGDPSFDGEGGDYEGGEYGGGEYGGGEYGGGEYSGGEYGGGEYGGGEYGGGGGGGEYGGSYGGGGEY
jgi:hypothetical protein